VAVVALAGQVDIDRQFGQMQERANAVLNESRRILEETRRELSSALESGRQTIQQRAERSRGASGEMTSPTE
jgi:ABC-type transporter Mla subunit MlaD